MRRMVAVSAMLLGLALMSAVPAGAGEKCHHANGVVGLKAASVPPPGIYYCLVNNFYDAGRTNDADGNEMGIGFDLRVFALVNVFMWVSDIKVWGADFGASVAVPLASVDISIDAFSMSDRQFNLGDINVEPVILAWHRPRYDVMGSFSCYVPSGMYDTDSPASPGRDMWTPMLTLGGTYFPDAGKKWSASVLARYEVHSPKSESDITLGNDFLFDWGVGRSFAKFWEAGLTGYCAWQVADDRGSDVTWNKDDRDAVYAVGPEVKVFVPAIKTAFSLRAQAEPVARDHSSGINATLTLVKIL